MRTTMLACLALLLSVPIQATDGYDAGWFELGDVALRNDLQLLNDAEIIRLPVNQWPLPRAAVAYALAHGREQYATNAAVIAALARVRARLGIRPERASFSYSVIGGDAGLFRDFDALARDNGELRARATMPAGQRAEVSLTVSAALDPDDERDVRLDGSHATIQFGNWLLSAQTLERWWGPSHESSLILSNNARPLPSVMVERATARAFETPWLSWLGPWRFSFGIGQMEGERQDIDSPLFMAWRITVMPFRDIEVGFSRTAQFCGDELICDADSFFNMLAGNDNVGFDTTPETEPGNQMAGFDMRWASPIGSWPYAVYGQMIGEDESSYMPSKYLAQFGIDVWKPLTAGGLVQLYAEYGDTSCSATSGSGPYYDCAYNQGRFNVEGYRYYGRSIGHTLDRDSRSVALGGSLTTEGGEVWSATARAAEVNFGGEDDVTNPVTRIPLDYGALEFGWRGRLAGGQVVIDLGVEALRPQGGEHEVQAYGYLGWRHGLP